jgi:antitoxin VapB
MAVESKTRRVRLFKNGRNQAVRIPREFELPGDEALLYKDSQGRLVLEPSQPKDIFAFLATLTPLSDEDALPEIPRPPAEPFDL